MIVPLCYILLCAITFYCIFSTIVLIKKTSSLILVLPVWVIYFWSIYGAWDWIPMKLSGGYDFYETIMFPVDIDIYYLDALVLYSLFILFFSENIKRIAKRRGKGFVSTDNNYYLSCINLLDNSRLYKFIVFLSFFCFTYFSAKNISVALSQGVSAYQQSRFGSVLGSAGSLVEFSGDMFLFLAIPLVFSSKKILKKYIILPIVIFYITNMLLGNRNSLLCGLAEGCLLSVELFGLKNVFRLRNIIIGLFLLTAIQITSFIRGMNVNDILAGDFQINLLDILGSTGNSGEKYAAQISMYGVLKKDVPFSYGASIISLLFAFIPTFFATYRPEGSYLYYVKHTMGGKPELGVTINHATDWYINFGVLGIFAGAYVWSYLLGYLYSRRFKFHFFMACILFSSVSIQLIRSGIESYKGTFLMNALIPLFIIRYCLKTKK